MKISVKAAMAVIFVALIMATGFYYWRSQTFNSEGFEKFKSLDTVENDGLGVFSIPDLTGNPVTQEEFKNKVVVLNAWASWCAPCVEEMPSLFEAVKFFNGKIALLAVSMDQNQAEAKRFLDAFPDKDSEGVTIVFDQDKYFSNRLKIDRLPETFIIDKKGRIVKKVVGTLNWASKDALDYLKSLEDQ
jgi:cytochrome c biogenesis protein CcmG/thiol:disulfide interchange protein DsbE